jgi:hypothetical protein
MFEHNNIFSARQCEDNQIKCADGIQCYSEHGKCNGYKQCYDESDEDDGMCKGWYYCRYSGFM